MNRAKAVAIGGGVVLILIIAGFVWLVSNANKTGATGAASKAATSQQATSTNTGGTSVDQLQSTDETVGTGAEAVAGKTVTVNYVGTLTNGTKFDSSYDRNQPFTFSLGAGQVIQGWDTGVVGMKVGGKRKLVIPPSLGYGAQATGSIPANSTLVFEIELLGVK
jgi:peptidylprolyl isomerase